MEQINTSAKQPLTSSPVKHVKNPPKTTEEVKKNRCNHGPTGKCTNCIENIHDIVKATCKHGPNEKCINCTVSKDDKITKHVSFEHYLIEKKIKCKGQHKPD